MSARKPAHRLANLYVGMSVRTRDGKRAVSWGVGFEIEGPRLCASVSVLVDLTRASGMRFAWSDAIVRGVGARRFRALVAVPNVRAELEEMLLDRTVEAIASVVATLAAVSTEGDTAETHVARVGKKSGAR